MVSEILLDQHCRERIPMQHVSGWKEWRASCVIQEKNDKDLRRQPRLGWKRKTGSGLVWEVEERRFTDQMIINKSCGRGRALR